MTVIECIRQVRANDRDENAAGAIIHSQLEWRCDTVHLSTPNLHPQLNSSRVPSHALLRVFPCQSGAYTGNSYLGCTCAEKNR